MYKTVRQLLFILIPLLPISAHGYPSLQLFADLTPIGGTLRPPPGTYSGPLLIKKPITLDGQGQVTIDGDGQGTVIEILADRVTLKNLHITHSGESHDQVDAGILIKADQALVENNHIDDVLFGIHLQKANGNTLRNNRISSRPYEPSLRGESIRLWYSAENLIEENQISQARDFLLTNSSDNRILGNRIGQSRIGMELIFSHDNLIQENSITDSDTGLVLIYSDGVAIRKNRIAHLRNIGSSALAIKESSGVRVEQNLVLHCRTGLTANTPTHPENIIELSGNRFLYNDIAMYFYGDKGGHIITGNRFQHNVMEVAVSAPTSARGNRWEGNHWQNYQGFDRNGDGIGDTPYELYLYSDRLWMDRPMIQFYRSSPLLETLDFIERLAPFSEPQLVLRDPRPRVSE